MLVFWLKFGCPKFCIFRLRTLESTQSKLQLAKDFAGIQKNLFFCRYSFNIEAGSYLNPLGNLHFYFPDSVGDKLQHSILEYEVKHFFSLRTNHLLTDRIIEDIHRKHLHPCL